MKKETKVIHLHERKQATKTEKNGVTFVRTHSNATPSKYESLHAQLSTRSIGVDVFTKKDVPSSSYENAYDAIASGDRTAYAPLFTKAIMHD